MPTEGTTHGPDTHSQQDSRIDRLVRQGLDRLRLKLLDLTNRNRLLNFKFSERSKRFVRIVDEVPDQLYQQLTDERTPTTKLYFVGLPNPPDEPVIEQPAAPTASSGSTASQHDETAADGVGVRRRTARRQINIEEWARACGIDPSYELPRSGSQRASHQDNQIQTLHFADELEYRLAAIREEASLTQQEVGISTLYAAIGFLEWYEAENSDDAHFAPLVLLPLQIDRELKRHEYRYFIQCGEGADPVINITLRERLKRDFGLALPELEEEELPEHYMQRVERAIHSQKRWRVRRMAVVGHFSFARLAMYEDLSPESWLDTPLERHPLIAALLAGQDGTSDDDPDADHVEPDSPEAEQHVPVLITDADSSQFGAVLEAMQGRSFALKGPPGTGKSQTITNLIAAALGKGKRVLFVAEKMAALNVVANRLEAAGLGEFLLELHSTKVQKKRVLESFARRLRLRVRGDDATLKIALENLRRTRDALRHYVEVMNRQVGRSGYTLHEAYWEEQRARRGFDPAVLREVTTIRDPSATDIDQHELAERCALLEEIASYWSKCADVAGAVQSHPLFGVEEPGGPLGDRATLLADCAKLRDAAERMRRVSERVTHAYRCAAEERLQAYRAFAAALKALPASVSGIEAGVLGLISTKADVASLRELERDMAAVCQGRSALGGLFADPSDLIARSSSLIEQAMKLNQHLESLGLAGTCRLPQADTLGEFEHATTLASRTIAMGERFCSAAGISTPLGLSELRNLLKALTLLRTTPAAVLNARSSRLYEPDAEERLAVFAREAAALHEQLRGLSSALDLEQVASPAQLRAYARVLTDKSAFTGLFSPEYRAAKRHHREVAAERKAARADIAQLFAEAATILARRDAFNTNSDLQAIAGTHFKGLFTPISTLQGVVAFAKRVREQFSSLRPDEEPFLDTLLHGKTDLLFELMRSVSETDQQQVERWSRSLPPREGTTAAELAASQVAHIEAARRCIAELRGAGLTRDVSITEFIAQLRQAKQIAGLLSDVRRTPAFAALSSKFAEPTDEMVQRLRATLDYADQVLEQPLPKEIRAELLSPRYAAALDSLGKFSTLLGEACTRFDEALEQFTRAHKLIFSQWMPVAESELSLRSIEAKLAAIEELPESALTEWTVLCRLRAQANDRGALGAIIRLLEGGTIPAESAARAYRNVHFRSLIASVHQEVKELPAWTGERMSNLRSRLAKLDLEYLQASREYLRWSISRWRAPPGISRGAARDLTERALIEHEVAKQRRHLPVRELLRRAGSAARALKPCFMMSPASVAQFLAPTGEAFDILIIDEASQMRPEEAIGALARSRQAIVVGDPMQLPPTSFFDASHDDVTEDFEEDQVDVDTESVLDQALSCWRPPRELHWHYRSRHHSLIAFSNREFYDDRLVVFPSPVDRSDHLGVELVAVEDGVYRSHVNEREAEAVVNYVKRAMRLYPNKSIGVVAINQPQKDLLLEHFDRMFADDSVLEDYRARWAEGLEPFMVKNLENVQGDERDIIVISTVYGPTEPGGPVMQRFGPINTKVGHRRLNVLFTRAKEKVVVVSSLKPENILLQPRSSPGVLALKGYLEYARSGRLEGGAATGKGHDSPFEQEVADIIRELGYQAEPQIGVAGYFLDLAVRHPHRPEHFVLGIECDGATYHSARSARDRDRLRQEVLQRLGWKLYRIWSTDWYANRDREIRKLAKEIELSIASV